jgi:hypothetical protein
MASGHRVHCIYSTEREGPADEQPSLGTRHRTRHDSDHEPVTPGEFLRRLGDPAPGDRMEDHFQRARRAMPVLLGTVTADQLALADNGTEDPLTAVHHLSLSAFRLPYGGLVLCLTVQLDADLPALVDLLHRTTFAWDLIRLDGRPLDRAAAEIPGAAAELGPLTIATDVHHLVTVDNSQIPVVDDSRQGGGPEPVVHHGAASGSGTAPPDGVDTAAVQSLLFRTTRPVRPSHAEVHYPTMANRDPDALVAVGPAVTALRTTNREVEGWVLWSMLRLTAAYARLRQIESEAYGVLDRMDLAETERRDEPQARNRHASLRAEMARLSDHLGQLQLQLSYGVVAHLNVQVTLPSPMLARTHRALTEQMGFPGSCEATSQLLSRATAAVEGRARALQAHERSRDEARQKQLDVVLAGTAAVALVLAVFFGFFGSNASPISENHRPFFHSDYAGFHALLLTGTVTLFLLMLRVLRRSPGDT